MNSILDVFRLPCHNLIASFCLDEDCNQNSPFCGSVDCETCQIRHTSKCSTNTHFSYIAKSLKAKLRSISELEKSIDELSDELIKIIAVWTYQIKTTAKQLILTDSQRLFLQHIDKRELKAITTSMMKRVNESQRDKIDMKLADTRSDIQKGFGRLAEQIKPILEDIKHKIAQPVVQTPRVRRERPVYMTSKDIELGQAYLFLKSQKRQKRSTTLQSPEDIFVQEFGNTTMTTSFFSQKTDTQNFIFDPSINEFSFKISANGKSLSVLRNDTFNFAVVTPSVGMGSNFTRSFYIKRFQKGHSMYFGLCNMDKLPFCDFKCHLDQSSHSFLIKQSGEVYNFFSKQKYIKSKFSFKQGDTITITWIPWTGLVFENKTTGIKTQAFSIEKKNNLNICFALSSQGNEIQIMP